MGNCTSQKIKWLTMPWVVDADALGDVVRDVEVGRPDGTDDLGHGGGASIRLDGMPEECGDGSGDDGEAREVPAEGGPHGHGEGDVKTGADHAVEDQGNGADQAAEDDADNSLTPTGDVSLRRAKEEHFGGYDRNISIGG